MSEKSTHSPTRLLSLLTFFVWTIWLGSVGYFFYQMYTIALHPHFLPALLLVGAMLLGTAAVFCLGLKRLAFGPKRLAVIPWMILAVIPPFGFSLQVFETIRLVNTSRDQPNKWYHLSTGAPVLAAADAWCRLWYPHWEEGEKVVLIAENADHAKELVAKMDAFIKELEQKFEITLPEKSRWVRGSVFGFDGYAVSGYALCDTIAHFEGKKPYDQLTYLDYHEVAHTVITQAMSRSEGAPNMSPDILVEGFAESHSTSPKENADFALHLNRNEKVTLREFVSPDWYYRNHSRSYRQGAALVNYLIAHYGYPKFLQIYSQGSIHNFETVFKKIYGVDLDTIDMLYLEEAEKVAKEEIVYDFHPVPKELWEVKEETPEPKNIELPQYTEEQSLLIEEMRSAFEKQWEYYNTDIQMEWTADNSYVTKEKKSEHRTLCSFAGQDFDHRRVVNIGDDLHHIRVIDPQWYTQYSPVDPADLSQGYYRAHGFDPREHPDTKYNSNPVTPDDSQFLKLPEEYTLLFRVNELTPYEENGERLVRLDYTNRTDKSRPKAEIRVVHVFRRDHLWTMQSSDVTHTGVQENADYSQKIKTVYHYDTTEPLHLVKSVSDRAWIDKEEGEAQTRFETTITKFAKGPVPDDAVAPPELIVKRKEDRPAIPFCWFPVYFYSSVLFYPVLLAFVFYPMVFAKKYHFE